MKFEQAAALRPWAVDVDIGGQEFTVPALSAVDWALAMLEPIPSTIIPGLLGPADRGRLTDLLLSGLRWGDVEQAALEAVEAAAGVAWWTAYRLVATTSNVQVAAELVLCGTDPQRLPLGAYLAATYGVVGRAMDQAKLRSWTRELERPPPGYGASRYDEESAESAFRATIG